MKDFIIRNNANYILSEYENNNSLTDKSRRKFISLAVQFMEELFGLYPNKEQKYAVAHACIELFPAYKTKQSNLGGIVSISFFTLSKTTDK